jgi:hypothetical protein
MSLKDDQSHLDRVRAQLESAVAELSTLLGKDGPVSGGSGAASSQLAKHVHFKMFRDYIEHEDGLIDKRLLWNINIQGFLFATYGFSVQKLAEMQALKGETVAPTGITSLRGFMVILPMLGIVISILSFVGVIAAQRAIAQLSHDWHEAEKEHLPNATPPPDGPRLPGIIGGGYTGETPPDECDRLAAHKGGFRAPLWFPWIFVVAWLLVLVSYFGPIVMVWFKFGRP